MFTAALNRTMDGSSQGAPSPATQHAAETRAARWTGRILTGLVAAFAALDAIPKLIGARFAVDATVQLGYQPHHVQLIGAVAAIALLLYLIPRTAPLGALLWTAYLGGAVASNVRVDNPLFSHTLFPVYFAVVLWAALYLRDERVRGMIRPVRR